MKIYVEYFYNIIIEVMIRAMHIRRLYVYLKTNLEHWKCSSHSKILIVFI